MYALHLFIFRIVYVKAWNQKLTNRSGQILMGGGEFFPVMVNSDFDRMDPVRSGVSQITLEYLTRPVRLSLT